MAVILAFIIGSCIGSFLSVVVARLGHQEGIAAGRSECPECKVRLVWYDLIPVVSFVLLARRCRHCRALIPWSYLGLEVISGAVFALFMWRHGTISVPELMAEGFIVTALLALLFFDYRHLILPDRIVVPLGLFALGQRIIQQSDSVSGALAVSFALAAIFGILYVVSHGAGVGFGDVKLVFVIGLIFGYPSALAVVIMATWLGALVGIGLLLTRQATGKTALPFGSFLALVAILFIIFPYEPSIITYLFR